MSAHRRRFDEAFARMPLCAILRGIAPEEAEAIGAALLEAGIQIMEVPLNSPRPLETIAHLVGAFGERAVIGAGTVLDANAVEAVVRAGGRLIVAPNFEPDVVAKAMALGVPALPGVFTPTEAFTALRAGATALKLFPAEAMSPKVVSAIRAVLPREARLVPVGGISDEGLAPWIAAGAAGFGLGSWLYKPGRSAAEVVERARAIVAAWRAARGAMRG